tara:strand:- start:3215 stop:4114 length:900 start_codon:yes stop_codon:yes gene_type:complete
MQVLDLFSGIGGFSLGLEKAGMETVAFCEIEDYPRKVLEKHWPGIPIYNDVTKLSKKVLDDDGITIDVICGGFPCQDLSVAGKQKGIEGERSGLWTECARLLRDIRPKYAIFENVSNLLSGDKGKWFQRVLFDISEAGYDAEWHCIRASDIGAWHHRNRVWIICYPKSLYCDAKDTKTKYSGSVRKLSEFGKSNIKANLSNTECKRRIKGNPSELAEGEGKRSYGSVQSEPSSERPRMPILKTIPRNLYWETEPNVGRVANGVPNSSHRLKCLGNAVVPQIPEILGEAIMNYERQNNDY